MANAGGHLLELLELSRRLPTSEEDSLWVTFDGPQSRSLLANREVVYVKAPGPRDYRALGQHAASATRILTRRRFAHAYSTGSGIALPFLGLAQIRGVSCHYIESATRILGPSMTGKVLSGVPGVKLYTQHRSWVDHKWRYIGSVFDGFEGGGAPARSAKKIVVTVGSSQQFGFRRLIDRVTALVPQDAVVLWQTGSTNTEGFPHETIPYLPALELMAAMEEADVVIAHAGVGTALTAMLSGRSPILVPRLRTHGEHIDDHQLEIAAELGSRGLALSRTVDELTSDDLKIAASRKISRPAQLKLVELST